MRGALLSAAAGCVVLVCARSAEANGRFPQANQILLSPKDPNLVVARTTYGILPSHDNGKTWYYLCEDIVGLDPYAVQDPEMALTANETLLAATSASSPPNFNPLPRVPGLNVSTDVGCNWSCAGGPLAGQSVADIVVRPDDEHTVLALTGTPLAPEGGALAWSSQVFQSTDDGATWSALGKPLDPQWIVTTIDVAKTDPNRIYVSAARGLGPSEVAALLVSTDKGATWTEHDVPMFDPTLEDKVWIGAVDPADANRVYLRSNALKDGGRSRLYATTDGGQTFTEPKSFDLDAAKPSYVTGELMGFALSPDGSKVYIGSSQGGLYVADRASLTFAQTSSMNVHCLATRAAAGGATELWICSDLGSSHPPFHIGVSTDDGATVTPKMTDVADLCGPALCCPNPGGPLGCGASFNGASCRDSYVNFCAFYQGICGSGCPGGDPGDPDLADGAPGHRTPGLSCGADGGANTPSGDAAPSGADAASNAPEGGPNGDAGLKTSGGSSSSCGCSVVGGRGAAGLVAAYAIAMAAGWRRRRSRRSRHFGTTRAYGGEEKRRRSS